MSVQEIEFELIKKSLSFGEQIVFDLKRNKHLWEGVVVDRPSEPYLSINLIKLRDISKNVWNVSTLFILSSQKNDTALEAITNSWGADEVDWIIEEKAILVLESHKKMPKILRVWWEGK